MQGFKFEAIDKDPNFQGQLFSKDGSSLGRVTQGFGNTQFAMTSGYYKNKSHPGIDIVLNDGIVKSFVPGEVIFVGEEKGWGGQVKVKGVDGRIYQYSHLRDFNVKEGDKVSVNTQLGLMGGGANDPMKGASTGRHLDFSVKENESWVNPLDIITKDLSSSFSDYEKTTVDSPKKETTTKLDPKRELLKNLSSTSPTSVDKDIQKRYVLATISGKKFSQTLSDEKKNELKRDMLQSFSGVKKIQTNKQKTPTPIPEKPKNESSSYSDKIIKAISTQESNNNYKAVGPTIPGVSGRALGKYQIMTFNIPSWSKEILGREVSEQEFLNNPEIQETIAQGKLNQYEQKARSLGLSDEDTARYVATAWYAGPGRANSIVKNGKIVYGSGEEVAQKITGGSAPSIKNYGDSVLNIINTL